MTKLIKQNTKLYTQLLNAYAHYNAKQIKSIFNAYNKPSIYKERVENHIKQEMADNNGFNYIIWGHNCMAFCCSYEFIKDNKHYLKIFTKDNTKILEI